MPLAQFQQCQRHADFVIQIAACRQYCVIGNLVKYQGQHFLHRGFAAAAGQRHQRSGKSAAPGVRQLRQTRARMVHHDDRILRRQCRDGVCRAFSIHHHRHRTRRLCRTKVLVRVKTFAAQRDEQFARLDVAAVGAYRGKGWIAADVLDAQRERGFGDTHHERAALCNSGNRASAALTTSASLKGWRTPRIS